MAGFTLESFEKLAFPPPIIKLLDLGGCEITDGFEVGSVLGAWAYWNGSNQWRIEKARDRVLLIEGQPDRYPDPDESVERWLLGRSGSFRGFEVIQRDESVSPRVLVFTDPLGTRPVYLLLANDRICASDKLATLALNCSGFIEPDWGGVLESAALGSLYSHKTTLKDAILLAPGEAIEFQGRTVMRRWKNRLPADTSLGESEVRSHPADTLRFALTKAIRETWTDPETHLLLSGGLDSRILLALATGNRKALTLELYPHETEIARRVAAVSGAKLEVFPIPDYEYLLHWSYLVTAAMHDSRFTTHMGFVADWRKRGIPGITHGYFHNTMYRGWAAKRFERFPNTSSILFQWMGHNAYYFDRYGCMPESLPRHLDEMLSVDGRTVLRGQLRELADSMQTVIIDGYDLTFERRLLDFPSRQVFFGVMLGWYEGIDVASPVFQPALWSWYDLSRPGDRDRDWGIREVFLKLDHAAAKLPDSNTGELIAHPKTDWRDRVRNQIWYPPFRGVYQRFFGRTPVTSEGGLRYGSRLRDPRILTIMEESIAALRNCPLFEWSKVESALDTYRSGDNELVDAVCALTSASQWVHFVKDPESLTKFVRVFVGQHS